MKKLILTLSFLAFTINAQATVHYFHNGSPDNTLPCTLADPCDNFPGTTLDNAGAIAAGESVLFKAGDTWTGTEAEIAVRSNGTANNHILFGRYGTGANPKFAGGTQATPTWTYSGANGIYYTSDTAMNSGNQPIFDVDADAGLMRTFANNNALEAGSWCFSSSSTAGTSCANFTTGSFLFIRRYDSSDPTGHPFIKDTSTHNGGNGDRGLVRTTTDSSYGDYVDFVDLDIEAPGGIGFSTSGYNTRTLNLDVNGAPRDGMLGYCSTGSSELGSYWEDYYSTTKYSSSFGVGYGQGITTYCDNTYLIGTIATKNGMFGIDYLDFGTSSDVTQGLCMRCQAYDNGLNPQTNNYDSNIYLDGASETMIYGARTYKAGVGSSGAGNARGGSILVGSEHPVTDPAEKIDVLNSYAFGVHYAAFGLNNTITNSNIKSIRLWWNTFSAYNAGSFEVDTFYQDLDPTAHHYENFYNIWLGDNSAVPMALGTSIDLYYMDYNGYYRRGGSTTFFSTSANKTLAQWQADSGEDTNSLYGDPLFVTDSDTTADLHLQGTSPYLDFIGTPQTFTYQSWIPTTVKNDIGIYGVKGSTIASGVYDNVSVDADAGFHFDYPSLINETITPASSTASANTTYSISFTIPQYVTALKYNWKIKVVFPAGTTLNSGGTTAVTNISGFNGGATASVSGQTVTVTRDGDGYSTFPGTISFDLTNIGNPTAGTSGTYEIYTTDENDNQIATADSDIAGNTFTAGVSQQVNVSGTINFSGVIRLS